MKQVMKASGWSSHMKKLGSADLKTTFDYVIVGAGSAGCVLAHRLVKEHNASVLLLEAGKSNRGHWDSWKNLMPAALTFNLDNKKYNWDYHTVPQKHADNRSFHQPRGKVLGGSSSLNAMAYVRGHALDYERWATEIGDDTWSYAHILPYFKKAQSHDYGGDEYRGGDGPLAVGRRNTPIVTAINEAFIEGGVQAGYPRTDDMNGFQQEGFGWMDMTVAPDGLRASTAERYLWPLLQPQTDEDRVAAENLTVVTGAVAHKIRFEGKRATGLEVSDSSGNMHVLSADREVILSAGAVASPQLLNLSGIGDAADLKSLNIPVFHDLPGVGKNLQDHLEFYIQTLATNTSLYPYAATWGGFGKLSKYLYRRPWNSVPAGLFWFGQGIGMCATNSFEVGAFLRSTENMPHPDIQYHFIPGCVVGQLEFLPHHGYQVHCGTMRPTSRGTIKLTSKDPNQHPLIDPNFLATEKDVIDHRNAFRLTVEMLNAKAFDGFRLEAYNPGADFPIDDDAAVDAWVRKNSHSGYHLSCTCAMGSVVDGQGKVFGLDSLRVVDASIMPSMTSGNLNAPTVMLAEKIADSIRGESLAPAEGAKWYVPEDWETKQR